MLWISPLFKPWFSKALFTSCKRKNSFYKQFELNPTALINKLRYNKYRNKYNFLARKKYFHDKLSLHSLYKFYVSCFVFLHFNCLLPASLSSLFHFNYDFHLTRSHFNLQKMSLVRYQFAISSQAPIIWNEISLSIRNSLTTTNF